MSYFETLFAAPSHALLIDEVIRRRRTRKFLGSIHNPALIPLGFSQQVEQAIKVAGWAPFHFPAHAQHSRGSLNSCVPWRFYALDQTNGLQLAHCLLAKGEATEQSGIIRMLAAAGSVVLVTWLPEPEQEQASKVRNNEHLAAAAAAVQNLLLASEARHIQTYWSSGGVLASTECFAMCQIPAEQQLLGAIFMFPPQAENVEAHEGKLRDRRGSVDSWRKWVTVPTVTPSTPV